MLNSISKSSNVMDVLSQALEEQPQGKNSAASLRVVLIRLIERGADFSKIEANELIPFIGKWDRRNYNQEYYIRALLANNDTYCAMWQRFLTPLPGSASSRRPNPFTWFLRNFSVGLYRDLSLIGFRT